MYKRTFKRCGRKVVIGKGITLRHPGRVSLGDRVAIDDYTLIDASGDPDQGIVIGDDVVVSRNCVIQAKCGPVVLGRRTDIGCNTIVTSISGIELGDAVLIAGHCYLGGGRYTTAVTDAPIMDQDFESRGRLVVGDGAWLGAGVTVLDGIRVGRGCVVGAGAVVTKDLPDYAIAVGVPARVIGMREGCKVGGDTTPRQPILA